jgi:CubicO group peptidase (beta-lactamase class C family)
MKTKGQMLPVVVLVLFALCALPARNIAAAQGPIDSQELQAFFDSVISAQLKAYHIPGATVSVVKNGQLFFAGGYGDADLAKHKPVVADRTLFGPGSIAKLFTWSGDAASRTGRTRSQYDVNLYLKDFQIPATYLKPITLAHLMTHSAGFDDPYNFYTHNADELVPLSEFVARHMPARVRPPEELSTYSNYGVALAGYIVECCSPSNNTLRTHPPLDMQHTTLRQPIPASPTPAIGYTCADGAFRVEPFVYIQTAVSMFTTATDMAHFMIAQLEGGQFEVHIFTDQHRAQQMQQPLFTNDPHVMALCS